MDILRSKCHIFYCLYRHKSPCLEVTISLHKGWPYKNMTINSPCWEVTSVIRSPFHCRRRDLIISLLRGRHFIAEGVKSPCWEVTYFIRSPFHCIWGDLIIPLLRGHLCYKVAISLQKVWPYNPLVERSPIL
jgi:hypothetical protein